MAEYRITAPCEVGGESKGLEDIGSVVSIDDPAEASHLVWYGQVVAAVEEAPAEEAPAEEAPAGEAPAEEAPAEEAPAEEAPAGEAPAEETPAGETPAEEAPAEETPAEEAPAGETPAEETPAEETPAEEAVRTGYGFFPSFPPAAPETDTSRADEAATTTDKEDEPV